MTEPIAVRAPVENVNDETVAVVRWLVENGAFVDEGTPLLLAETTKTSFDISAPVSGYFWRMAEEGTDVPVGDVICYVGQDLERLKVVASPVVVSNTHGNGTGAIADSRPSDVPNGVALSAPTGPPARFSRKAAELVKLHGLDPALFAGRGLVQEKDVLAYRTERTEAVSEPASLPSSNDTAVPTGVSPAMGVATKAEQLSRSKRFEVRHLRAASLNTIPSAVTISIPRRSGTASQPDVAGLRSAALIAETGRLLRRYPMFNAFYSADHANHYEDVNIGFAFDLGNGLKVPVIRHADRKTVLEINEEKQRLLVDYLDNSLSLESLTAGTFTITDLSGEGVTHFQPVINDGQSAILGVCADTVWGEGQAACNLVLAFDHQLADGRTAATFLRELRERLIAHDDSSRAQVEQAVAEPACSLCLRPASELEASRHFLVRTVRRGPEQTVCTICLQDWYS